MADSLPRLTSSDVSRRVGSASFGRSKRYIGQFEDMRREGRTLTGSCQGSMMVPYDVTVTFNDTGIARADCSCPVGDGGYCKHVAALLQTWIRDPESFAEMKPVGPTIKKKSRDELVGLVEAMIARHPDLRELLEMPLPGSGQGTLSASVIEKQVRRAFAGALYEWGSAYCIGRELTKTLNQADVYVQHQEWANAVIVSLAILHGVQEHYERMEDHDGHLTEVVNTCVSHLGACLEHTRQPDARVPIVEALFEVLTWDIAIGGIDLGYEAMDFLKTHATDEERAALCKRVEADLARTASSTGYGSSWRREALGGLLIELTPGEMDDEAYIALCRASGRTADLIDALLELRRVDEALEAARAEPDLPFLQLAHLFEHHNQDAAFDALALGRLDDTSHWRLVEWLQERARVGGNTALALQLAERRFTDRPSASTYTKAIELATSLGTDDEVRPRLRRQLKEKKAYSALVHAYLHDGEPEKALKLVYREEDWPPYTSPKSLRLTVAAAVASSHPDDAIQIYLEAASDCIDRRGRGHYADAAGWLLRARDIHRATGQLDAWHAFIRAIRDDFKNLPALQDELTKAGL
ncbi:MAG: hypothetical protein Rubg2KO_17050 [Rubricoccaceae bacterium]